MASIGPESRKLLQRSLGRLQACVDQMVGVNTLLEAGPNDAHCRMHAAHALKVLELLQGQLDTVFEVTEESSPSAMADGSEWLLKNLRP